MKTTTIIAVVLLFILSTTPRVSAENKVLDVRATSDYVTIPDSDSLDLVSTSFTLEAWINPAIFTSTDGTIIGKRRLDGGTSYHLSVSRFGGNSSLQQARAVVGMNNGDGVDVINYALFSPQEIRTNVWCHIAATYDRAGNSARVYINGELKASEPAVLAVPLQNSPFPVTIGQLNLTGEPRNFIGQIDEVRVWNRALSQTEIQTKMSLRLTGQESGLVGYWTFDAGTANDSSSLRNNGQLVGQAKIADGFAAFPKPVLLNSRFGSVSGFRFTLQGDTDTSYQLEASTNLVMWTPLVGVKLTSASLIFTDPSATNFPSHRFYRARRMP